jgi:hypothetical protein
MRRALLLLAMLLPAVSAPAQRLTPLVAEVLAPPWLFPGSDGMRHLVWELRLANATPAPGRLDSVTVRDAATDAPLLRLEGAALAARFGLGTARGGDSTAFRPQQWGIVFLHLALPPAAPVPTRLVHEVAAAFAAPVGAEMTLRLAETAVIATRPVVLGPPLRGDGFVAGDGCCDSIRHVRAVLALEGGLYLAQRFAIDWERIGHDGRIFAGDPRDPHSYRIHGNAVLAVADGEVVATRSHLPDQVPGALPAGLPIEEADGNFIVLRLDDGRTHVLYAHLLDGSLTVPLHGRVRRGEVIGRVGNSGNSQAPHLHLHVMDGPSPLLASGVPYGFAGGTVSGRVVGGTPAFDKAEAEGTPLPMTATPPRALDGTMPMDLSIVDWPP